MSTTNEPGDINPHNTDTSEDGNQNEHNGSVRAVGPETEKKQLRNEYRKLRLKLKQHVNEENSNKKREIEQLISRNRKEFEEKFGEKIKQRQRQRKKIRYDERKDEINEKRRKRYKGVVEAAKRKQKSEVDKKREANRRYYLANKDNIRKRSQKDRDDLKTLSDSAEEIIEIFLRETRIFVPTLTKKCFFVS